ncbi:MAG: membrane protein insertion efficiency factor YidD [Alphaproteobacteria bacterium]|nr:MAG: membrane protein insertion efficiency factor YidD [Alphaproteobacteria bacterium]
MIISHYCQKFLISLIRGYQWAAPYVGIDNCCLFELSCSRYAIAALEQKGCIKGMGLIILRLLACQTFVKVPWFGYVETVSEQNK